MSKVPVPQSPKSQIRKDPSFRLTDGRVWSFSRADLDGIIQLVAADTTELSNINVELKVDNRELAVKVRDAGLVIVEQKNEEE